jgi:hypothetical protein
MPSCFAWKTSWKLRYGGDDLKTTFHLGAFDQHDMWEMARFKSSAAILP